jgi:hypothetical protein
MAWVAAARFLEEARAVSIFKISIAALEHTLPFYSILIT